ncbi:methyl-accepting chemotaxis protein [Clostridium cylindrosporum]|uniref:Putative sensory transducer protein n=1 Tax=Clostridium cylindrosporum DSM 605 TaxID=1121307 RepID=A0A0J8D9Q1_CLOCY|nr:methyl-accepting chemotaxis protein [Clostridium cylindrosporum]KMT21008.1 putative sensory transducer protein [Clostridium cylindrosporum DSM 605]
MFKLKNLKIGIKLTIGFALVALIVGSVGIIGSYNISKMARLDKELYDYVSVPLYETGIISESSERQEYYLIRMNLATEKQELQDLYNKLKEEIAIEDNAAKNYGSMILAKDGIEIFKAYETARNSHRDSLYKIINLLVNDKKAEASILLNQREGYVKLHDEKKVSINKLKDFKLNGGKIRLDSNQSTATWLVWYMNIISAISVVVAILLGILLGRMISKPLQVLRESANNLASGNLNVDIDIDTKDEVGMLARAFINMRDNVNRVLSDINSSSEQVESGARQVSDVGASLSQGATEQASAIEQLTASITEIDLQTKQNELNARKAKEVTDNVRKNAIEGTEQMESMLSSMEQINLASENISKIIKVIDDIAFQTNILALNAAVEAARAGQHGKGFAVVAEEVRNLAVRSADAAKETTDMIEDSMAKTEGGMEVAKSTASALKNIADGIQEASDMVTTINIATGEQAVAISEINKGIEQVSDVVQNNSAVAEESASAGEELYSQAVMLRQMVGKFKLKPQKNRGEDSYE